MAEEIQKSDEDQQLEEPVVRQDWMDDLQLCITHLTIIPIPGGLVLSNPSLYQASRFFPVIGVLIGLLGAFIFLITNSLGLPFGVAITLALGFATIITGGLNEEGLAKTISAVAGDAKDPLKRVRILRGRQLNALGVLTLIFIFFLKWIALNSLSVSGAALALITISCVSHSVSPILMRYVPSVQKKNDADLSQSLGFDRVATSILISLIISFIAVGFWLTSGIIIVLIAVTGSCGFWFKKLFNGHTDEVHRALQQISELSIVMTIAALGI